jgi:hypothetical protein
MRSMMCLHIVADNARVTGTHDATAGARGCLPQIDTKRKSPSRKQQLARAEIVPGVQIKTCRSARRHETAMKTGRL